MEEHPGLDCFGACVDLDPDCESYITEDIMLTKESSQGPSSISPEIPANSYTDAETSVFSYPSTEIAAVSYMNTETTCLDVELVMEHASFA